MSHSYRVGCYSCCELEVLKIRKCHFYLMFFYLVLYMKIRLAYLFSLVFTLVACKETSNQQNLLFDTQDEMTAGDIGGSDHYERYDCSIYETSGVNNANLTGAWVLAGTITLQDGGLLYVRSGFTISDHTYFPAVINSCGIVSPQKREESIGEYYYQLLYIGSDFLQLKLDYIPQKFNELKVTLRESSEYVRSNLKAFKVHSDGNMFGSLNIEELSNVEAYYKTSINCFLEGLVDSKYSLYMTASNSMVEGVPRIESVMEIVRDAGSLDGSGSLDYAEILAYKDGYEWLPALLKSTTNDVFHIATSSQSDKLESSLGTAAPLPYDYFVQYTLSVNVMR